MKAFLDWFEDNFGDEEYLHILSDEDYDNALEEEKERNPELYSSGEEWRPYSELPEYIAAKKELGI